MEIQINKSAGLRNDLLVKIPQREIDEVVFHIIHRDDFMNLPGLLRPKKLQEKKDTDAVAKLKRPVEEHLKLLDIIRDETDQLTDEEKAKGTIAKTYAVVQQPVVVIGSRNVGNNHGFVAWQRDQKPQLFQIKGEPWSYPSYSCLAKASDGRLEIKEFFNGKPGKKRNGKNVPKDVVWCVFGQQILKNGKSVPLEDIIREFQDIRHVLVVEEGSEIEKEIYDGYLAKFGENAWGVHSKRGVPRSRYLFNCLGLSKESEHVVIIQREGTTDEAAQWLQDEGAENGLILDNGASPFFWAWWVDPVEVKRVEKQMKEGRELQKQIKETKFRGGYLYTAPDFRPNSSAVLVFVLKGPAFLNLESGTQQSTII